MRAPWYSIDRGCVNEQLYKMMSDEFSDVGLGYIDDTWKETIVFLPESFHSAYIGESL